MRVLRHLLAIGLLPGVVAGVIPALILAGDELASWPLVVLGGAALALGLALIVQTVALFATVGQGDARALGPDRAARRPRARIAACATR